MTTMTTISQAKTQLTHKFFILLSIIALTACGGNSSDSSGIIQSSQEIVSSFAYYRNGCVGEANQMCLLQRVGDNEELFYDSIEGFEFEWGYNYTLRLLKTTYTGDLILDGSSYNYELLEVISQQAESSQNNFVVRVLGVDQFLQKDSVQQYSVEGKAFSCNPDDCATLDSLIQQKFSANLVFTLGRYPSEPLTLQSISCSAAQQSFFQSCP